MQSAQSDQAQFVDAINSAEPNVEVEAVKATAIVKTPPNADNQGLAPVQVQTAEEDVNIIGTEDNIGPFFSQESSKEDTTVKKLGSETEMKKISTEYVSNMLEKFEVDQSIRPV